MKFYHMSFRTFRQTGRESDKNGLKAVRFLFLHFQTEVAFGAGQDLLCVAALQTAVADSTGNCPADPSAVLSVICAVSHARHYGGAESLIGLFVPATLELPAV